MVHFNQDKQTKIRQLLKDLKIVGLSGIEPPAEKQEYIILRFDCGANLQKAAKAIEREEIVSHWMGNGLKISDPDRLITELENRKRELENPAPEQSQSPSFSGPQTLAQHGSQHYKNITFKYTIDQSVGKEPVLYLELMANPDKEETPITRGFFTQSAQVENAKERKAYYIYVILKPAYEKFKGALIEKNIENIEYITEKEIAEINPFALYTGTKSSFVYRAKPTPGLTLIEGTGKYKPDEQVDPELHSEKRRIKISGEKDIRKVFSCLLEAGIVDDNYMKKLEKEYPYVSSNDTETMNSAPTPAKTDDHKPAGLSQPKEREFCVIQ